MITAHDRNDAAHSRRIRHFLPLFESASPPDPEDGNWRAWETLMASRQFAEDGSVYDAMTIVGKEGFETLSSALIALPAAGSSASRSGDSPPGAPMLRHELVAKSIIY